jgi:copper(I)-binding protein
MKFLFAFVLLCITLNSNLYASENPVEISDPWIREGPPNASVLAGFMVLHNTGEEPVTITSFTSSRFVRIEIHRSVVHEGVMHMLHEKRLVVGAGKTVVFKPGGYHLMLFTPSTPPQEGEQIPIVIHIAGHETLTVLSPVRKVIADDLKPRQNHNH